MKILRDIAIPAIFVISACAICLPLPTHHHVEELIPPKEEPQSELLQRGEYLISPYDRIFQRIGAEYGIDWRLLSALGYVESKFKDDAVSRSGAIGLMQVMPFVAREYGVTPEGLLDPATNVEVAARLVKSIKKMLRIPASVDDENRLALEIACYNCGYAHITDARSLADYFDGDRNSWEMVSMCLELLAEPDFYEHEAVEFGKFTGSPETIAHVERVMKRYGIYCRRYPDAVQTPTEKPLQ